MFFLIENTWLIQSRYFFNLKKKVKNKAHVKASICEVYIFEEISTFILYYFEPHLRTRINHIPRHDDGSEVPSSENLSIFSNTRQPTPKNAVRGRCLSEENEVFQVSVLVNHIKLLLRLNWKKIQIFMFSMIVLLMLTQRSWMLFWA